VLHTGENLVNGVPVEVVRKRVRRINVRIGSDGRVHLSIPWWGGTLHEGEAFLLSKWNWVLKARASVLARGAVQRPPITVEDLVRLKALLSELNAAWSARVGEPGVAWKLRRMKTLWGSCHWRKRVITYNAELARAPRELVEYVVVHEFTHFRAHDHGPAFYALMDERLPGWRDLRRRLNRLLA